MAEPEEINKTGLWLALLRTIQGLQVSLQNILSIIAVFVVPFVVSILGEPMSIAVAAGSCVLLWFILIKALPHVRSKIFLFTFGGVCTVLVAITGFVIPPGTQTKPLASPVQGSLRPTSIRSAPTHGDVRQSERNLAVPTSLDVPRSANVGRLVPEKARRPSDRRVPLPATNTDAPPASAATTLPSIEGRKAIPTPTPHQNNDSAS